MHSAPRTCPVCQENLTITRLECRSCETSIHGAFAFSGLSQLSAEQLHFVETFVRCEGKFNRMEKEYNLSYPTLRTRLRKIIRSLGYMAATKQKNAPQEDGLSEAERADVLDQLSEGVITLDQAVAKLEE